MALLSRTTRGNVQRPVRGLAVLLLSAAVSFWRYGRPEALSFALLTSQQSVRQPEVALENGLASLRGAGLVPARANLAGGANLAMRPPKMAASIDGEVAGSERRDFRMADAVPLALASAGAATAMRAASKAVSATGEASLFDKLKVPTYIGLWYLFNIGYNIYNKQSLIAYPYPWACALWQMAFGWFIFVPLWLLKIRKTPKLTVQQAITLSPAALGHLATHVGAVIAFFAGAVSFGHIVKASEPVVSSILNLVFMGEVLHPVVYASLIPIIAGVGLASASELSFTWLCFGAAMVSNIGSASRAVYSKKVMRGGNIGENMDSANIYAVLTMMATVFLLPIALYLEGPSAMIKGFKAAYASGGVGFLWQMFYSGLFYYMYNEVAFLALGKLDPVSHAVCNTMKRVVIIIVAIFVFRTAVTPLGIAGSGIAIGGTLLYSLAKNKFK